MSVGVEEIDLYHRQLLRRVRHLANAVGAGGAREIRNALGSLLGHLVEHHAEEERWMSEAGYPAAKEHSRAHAGIVERIRLAREDVAAGSEGRLVAAAEWLARALQEHMTVDDLRLGRFWTARLNLRVLAERGPGLGASLTPIPGTIAPAIRPVSPGEPEREPGPGSGNPQKR